MQNIKQRFFSYSVFALIILFLTASYFRFVIVHDHLISYEGECDPYTEDCFVYCEDDACSEPFYYTVIERHAAQIYDTCSTDVTLCDEAYTCDGDESCFVYHCDMELDGDLCEDLTSHGTNFETL